MRTVKHGNWTWTASSNTVTVEGIPFQVCSFGNPLRGRYMLARRTEGWELTPVVFVTFDHMGMVIPDGEFILLTNSPDALNLEIEASLCSKGKR